MSFQSVILTQDQAKAFEKIEEFLDDDERKSFVLDGPAGSGKTTLLRHIKASLPDTCIVCAPTNKAVAVLRAKGFDKATTLDKVLNKSLYTPIRRPPTAEEILFHKENELPIPVEIEEENYEKIPADGKGTVVCLDEASMTNEAEFARLIDIYPKVIAVGDAFQLPPVEGTKWFQTAEPDIQLHEIVRTGEGSEITKAANLIRRKSPEWKKTNWKNEVTIISRHDRRLVERALSEADVTLALKNITCDDLNLKIRELKGLIPNPDIWQTPRKGDTLLAWETIKGAKIFKSETYPVVKAFPLNGGFRVVLDGIDQYIAISKANLEEQKTAITTVSDSHRLYRFSFAHCITAHKSQGSEWDKVVVLAYDKSIRHDDYWNWLYTAVSRAKKHLTIVI